jgi:hypothetical protein
MFCFDNHGPLSVVPLNIDQALKKNIPCNWFSLRLENKMCTFTGSHKESHLPMKYF